MRRMTDPVGFRLNDKDVPNRVDRLNEIEHDFGIDPALVIRRLVDAYLAYYDEHKTPPKLPVVLIPKEEFAALQEKTAGGRQRKQP